MTTENQRPAVVDGELVDAEGEVIEAEIVEAASVDESVDLDALLDPNPLPHLPAIWQRCACGKNGSAEAHGGVFDAEGRMVRAPFSCGEVLAIAARVHADLGRRPRTRLARLFRRSGGA
jgi:hypothetical protein